MAKTANNVKASRARASPRAKQAQAGKGSPTPKQAAAKPARGKAQPKSRTQARAAKPGEKRGLMKFLRDVRIELGKVTWPTRKDLLQSTLVVLVAVAIATATPSASTPSSRKSVDVVLSVHHVIGVARV